MKKKLLPLIVGLTLSLVIGVGVFFVTHNEMQADTETYLYSLKLTKDNQIQHLESSNSPNFDIGTLRSEKGTDIKVAYTMTMDIDPINAFAKLNEEDYFELEVPINGLLELQYDITGELQLDVGYDVKDDYIGTTTIDDTTGHTHTLNFIEDVPHIKDYGVPPCTFRITALKDNITINSMIVIYTCIHSPNPSKKVGNWEFTVNDMLATLTGFSIDEADIPTDHALYVPSTVSDDNGTYNVTKIKEGVLNNVPWLDHVILPFIGENVQLDQEGYSYNFASIFGQNSAHNKYRPIQQYEGTKVNIWYIPKSLNKVTVAGGNFSGMDVFYRYIPSYAFYGCASYIRTINITGEIQEFGQYSFTNCSAMKEIALPKQTLKVDVGAFTGCNQLMIRSLSNEVVFEEGSNPEDRPISIGYSETFIDNGIHYDICDEANVGPYLNVVGLDNDVEVANIPASVTHNDVSYNVKRIANRAFENKTNLRAIHFEESIQKVGNYAFQNCYRASVYVVDDPSEHPDRYASNWLNGLGGEVYKEFKAYTTDNLHVYEAYYTNYVIGVEGSLSDEITIDVSDLTPVVFPHYAFEGDVRIYSLLFTPECSFKPYSFANCPHLSYVEFLGTSTELETMKEEGKVGFNSFIGCATTQAKCSDGEYVSLL